MSKPTNIQWTDRTFNPWIGCAKVSPGCTYCYAEVETFARVHRAKGVELWGSGPDATRIRTSQKYWDDMHTFAADAPGRDEGLPAPRVFCASMADWLDQKVDIHWFIDLMALIKLTPKVDWQLLTKRIEHFRQTMVDAIEVVGASSSMGKWLGEWLSGYCVPNNVWIGVSVEDQTRANDRIPLLLQTPAAVRFLSMEPLLSPVRLEQAFPCGYYCPEEVGHVDHYDPRINWAIIGGESGPTARQCDVRWIRDLVVECRRYGISPFVKQLGSNTYGVTNQITKKGGDQWQWPEDLRVREFPKS